MHHAINFPTLFVIPINFPTLFAEHAQDWGRNIAETELDNGYITIGLPISRPIEQPMAGLWPKGRPNVRPICRPIGWPFGRPFGRPKPSYNTKGQKGQLSESLSFFRGGAPLGFSPISSNSIKRTTFRIAVLSLRLGGVESAISFTACPSAGR